MKLDRRHFLALAARTGVSAAVAMRARAETSSQLDARWIHRETSNTRSRAIGGALRAFARPPPPSKSYAGRERIVLRRAGWLDADDTLAWTKQTGGQFQQCALSGTVRTDDRGHGTRGERTGDLPQRGYAAKCRCYILKSDRRNGDPTLLWSGNGSGGGTNEPDASGYAASR